MSSRRILILDAHPDGDPGHFVHALAQAYFEAANAAGHAVLKTELARIDFPLLRKPSDWTEGNAPPAIVKVQSDIEWADHLVIMFPLWLGDMPALLKGFLEQAMRPGYALASLGTTRLPKKLLSGRSARVVVTMGMPALFYGLFYRAHSLKSLERNILKFVGFKPVEHTVIGGVEDEGNRKTALRTMRELGAAGV